MGGPYRLCLQVVPGLVCPHLQILLSGGGSWLSDGVEVSKVKKPKRRMVCTTSYHERSKYPRARSQEGKKEGIRLECFVLGMPSSWLRPSGDNKMSKVSPTLTPFGLGRARRVKDKVLGVLVPAACEGQEQGDGRLIPVHIIIFFFLLR